MEVLTDVKTTSPLKTWKSTPIVTSPRNDDEETEDSNLTVKEHHQSENEDLDDTVPVDLDEDDSLSQASSTLIFSNDGTQVNTLLDKIFDKPKEGGAIVKSDNESCVKKNDRDKSVSPAKNLFGDTGNIERNLPKKDKYDLDGSDSEDSTAQILEENFALKASCKVSEKERLRLFAEVEKKDEQIKEMESNIKLLKQEKKESIKKKCEEIEYLKDEIKKLQDQVKAAEEQSTSKEENKILMQLIQAAGDLLQTGSFYFLLIFFSLGGGVGKSWWRGVE